MFTFRLPGTRSQGRRDPVSAIFEAIEGQVPWCRQEVLRQLIELAIAIAREGREGRRIGTLFTLGESDRVLTCSRALILDPLAGHAPSRTSIFDEGVCGTVKELAQLDGAFVVRADGVLVGASRYLDTAAEGVDLPLGLGTRHLAAAATSKRLGIVAIVVSESAVVRVFCQGRLIAELIPEIWLFRHYMQRSQPGTRADRQRPPSGSE
ncbi:MAG: DNA integrity scanning protein DisA nucleotide-binding domain protein [Vicinamibacterales bacterium]